MKWRDIPTGDLIELLHQAEALEKSRLWQGVILPAVENSMTPHEGVLHNSRDLSEICKAQGVVYGAERATLLLSDFIEYARREIRKSSRAGSEDAGAD